jgi:bifunctional non-homologous end joining protein LigD
MALETYHRKRNFKNTPEPKGRVHKRRESGLSFVIQKHAATRLHYDFRLELNGVLLSWAVPKGPSLDPNDKRLAMHTEDHPMEYGGFEGVIPPKQYGSGTVLLWDRGTWIPKEDPVAGYAKGRLKFELHGEKLHGGWNLVRTRGGKYGGDSDNTWLLIKEDDEYARTGIDAQVVDTLPESVETGRTLEAIAADADRVWHSNRSVKENVRAGAVKKRAPKIDLAKVAGARKAADPAWVPAELATLVDDAPVGEEWVHEIKFDGYRMLCHVAKGACTIWSRNRKDWTAQLPTLAQAMARLPVDSAWIDGEVVVPDEKGHSSFQALQNAFDGGEGAERLLYYAFDVPYLDGYDLRSVPLHERKRVLRDVVTGSGMIRYSDHVEGEGETFFTEACRMGLEGIISKRRDAPYRGARGREWVKVKCAKRQELVIGGYTDPQGSRSGFGALLIGVYDANGDLRYAGKVGTGFTQKTLDEVLRELKKRPADEPAFVDPPTGAEGRRAHWVRPELVAEVSFTEWTQEGTLRHPSFQGLRKDKRPRDVVREVPAHVGEEVDEATPAAPKKASRKKDANGPTRTERESAAPSPSARKRASAKTRDAVDPPVRVAEGQTVVANVAISNPDKLLYPEANVSKVELARFYETIGDWIVPHLADRPLTLVRCPNGWSQHCFYQKHAKEALGQFLKPIEVSEGSGTATYMMANSTSAVVSLVQMGVLEIHPWGSRKGSLRHPDRIIFDFDPDESLPWSRLTEAVTVLRKLLDTLGLQGFVKTTGGKGLHVVVPVRPQQDWNTIKGFTGAIADLLVLTFPDRFTSKMTKSTRTGKIFVDYLRNAEGATAISAYSARAKKNAPVATPLAWDELSRDVRYDHFNVRTVAKRLRALKSDPWKGFFDVSQSITAEMMQRVGFSPR